MSRHGNLKAGRETLKRVVAGAFAAAALSVLLYRVAVEPVIRRSLAGPARLSAALADIRDQGLPIAPNQLQRPMPPASLNAAPIYTRLAVILKRDPVSIDLSRAVEDEQSSTGGPAPGELRALVSDRASVLALIHAAAARPQCVFIRDWSVGPWMTYPELQAMRTAAQLLQCQAIVLASQGRFEEALRDAAGGLRIAEHASSDPVMLGYLSSLACRSITIPRIAAVLRMSGPDVRVDSAADRLLRDPTAAGLPRALAGESVLMRRGVELQALGAAGAHLPRAEEFERDADDISAMGRALPPPVRRRRESRTWVVGLVKAAEAEEAEQTGELLHAAAKPYPERLRLFRLILLHVKTRSLKRTALDGLMNAAEPALDLAESSELESAMSEASVLARARVVRAAAAVLTYRAEHEVYPASLSLAISPPPESPYSGGSVSYHFGPNRFEVSCEQPRELAPNLAGRNELAFRYGVGANQS